MRVIRLDRDIEMLTSCAKMATTVEERVGHCWTPCQRFAKILDTLLVDNLAKMADTDGEMRVIRLHKDRELLIFLPTCRLVLPSLLKQAIQDAKMLIFRKRPTSSKERLFLPSLLKHAILKGHHKAIQMLLEAAKEREVDTDAEMLSCLVVLHDKFTASQAKVTTLEETAEMGKAQKRRVKSDMECALECPICLTVPDPDRTVRQCVKGHLICEVDNRHVHPATFT